MAKWNGEKQRVGVVILSFNEVAVILQQASAYPNIYNVHWWGSDGTAKVQRLMDDAPEQANHMGFYSLLSRETITPAYISSIDREICDLTKQQFTTYRAYSYDIWTVITSTMYQDPKHFRSSPRTLSKGAIRQTIRDCRLE